MVKVIICAFNIDKVRLEMLKVCLYSINKNTPFEIEVYYNNISNDNKKEIESKISRIKLINKFISINQSLEVASQKMYLWNDVIKGQKKGSRIILSDLDTLYLKDVSDAFDKDFDVGYTAKDDQTLKYPLNTGIVFIKVNNLTDQIMKEWLNKTEIILNNTNLSQTAIDTFGGADQKALSIIIGKNKNFLGPSENNNYKFFGYRTSRYNLHKDWSNPYNSGMIHYKSGWKDILVNDHKTLEEVMSGYREKVKYLFMQWNKSFELWRLYQKEYYSLK
jgi:hypothetical protein